MTSFPVDLALADVVRRTADGGTAVTLLRATTERTRDAMGAGACALVLGGPETGYAVHSAAPPRSPRRPGPAGPGSVPEQVLLSGPVLVTATSGATTTVNDLTAGGSRWPEWDAAAREAGIRGARCWPVTVAAQPVGALVVLTTDPWSEPGSGRSGSAGQALADLCAVILQLPPPAQRWGHVLAHLTAEVDQDVAVHQAVGMIAAAHETDVPTAAAALRIHAGRLAVGVSTLARDVVERRVAARDVPRA